MKTYQKILSLALILAALCLTCCACTSAEAPKEDTPADTSEFKTDAYTLTLPQGLTAQEASNGSVTFLLEDKEVGGIAVVPYENADQLTLEAFGEGDTEAADTLDNTLKDFLTLIVPDRKPDYMFSDSVHGSFTLSVVNEDGSNSMLHEFYPDGDQFYDVFLEEVSDVTPEQKETVWSSFALNP